MFLVYNLVWFIATPILWVSAQFSKKMSLFVNGRKNVWEELKTKLNPKKETFWFHAASLGEFEQGLPIMEALKKEQPELQILVSFFSPSGYEVRKNHSIADCVVYLPLDTIYNAKRFLKTAQPKKVFFIKYEFWPNYLNQLKKQHIETYLISGIFRKKQLFFKWYGGFYRKALTAFNHFFVQNESSFLLLKQLNFSNITLAGDTRFDRVATILEQNNTLDFIGIFKNNKKTIVIGSSWAKDEAILIDYINSCSHDVKFIIAPHNIKTNEIEELKSRISKKTVLFSEKADKNLAEFDVFIIDTIGLLTKIYAYADIAYVGGGFGNPGVHNILEPATFGVPIAIGPNYSHFTEATALVNLGGCVSISTKNELELLFNRLINNPKELQVKGSICAAFVQENKGATQTILNFLNQK